MKYWLLLGLVPFLLNAEEKTWQSAGQHPFEMTIKLSAAQLTLYDSLSLEVHFRYPSSHQLNIDSSINSLVKSANPLNPSWHLDHSTLVALSDEKELKVQQLHVYLTPLITGFLDLSFLRVSFQSTQNDQSIFYLWTPVFTIEVLPLPTQTPSLSLASLMPLEPQFPLGLTHANHQLLRDNPQRLEEEKHYIRTYLDKHTFPWLTILVLLGCLGISGMAYFTRELWSKWKVKPKPELPVEQKIAHAFAALKKRHLLKQGMIQTYYKDLGSILLHALHHLLKWKKKGITTKEIIHTLKECSVLSISQKQTIISFLTEIDQVKFAGKKPSLESAQQMHQNIQNFIWQELVTHSPKEKDSSSELNKAD